MSKERGEDKRQRPGFQLEWWRKWNRWCTDVRHFSRFLEEKEGFKWKWILNDGVIAGRSCTSHSSLTAGTGHHIAYYQWRACCCHSKIIWPCQKLGSGRCAVNFKSHFTNKGSSKKRSKWMIKLRFWFLLGSFISKHLWSKIAQCQKMMTWYMECNQSEWG